MKADNTVPLVGNPEHIATREPSITTDHSLPLRQAFTEAVIVAGLGLGIFVGLLLLMGWVGDLSLWGAILLFVFVGFLLTLINRYEAHIGYVRENRQPSAPPDLDADGKPDQVRAVWFASGVPAAQAGSIDAIYRRRFAEFCAAARAGGRDGTSIRYLRSSGFGDELQVLFRNWLMENHMGMERPAAQWVSERGKTPGWEFTSEDALRKVLKCTAWQEAL